jgi:hypothetical protein
MEQNELKRILEKHRKWVYGEGGLCADLYGAYLSGANLSGANLYNANLSHANLSGAYLSGANLSGANLSDADLSRAYLSGANLYNANLSRAYLSRAYLSDADLYGAYLSDADLYGANLSKAVYAAITILRAFWRLPADAKYLTLELMAHDAESCGIEAMDKWAADKGGCPFEHSERDYYFKEDKQLWLSASPADKVPKLRGRKLLEALAEACRVKL